MGNIYMRKLRNFEKLHLFTCNSNIIQDNQHKAGLFFYRNSENIPDTFTTLNFKLAISGNMFYVLQHLICTKCNFDT